MQQKWRAQELNLLGKTPIFQGVGARELREITEHPLCTREEFGRGAVIYSPKSFRRSLGVLLRGSARVTKGRLLVSVLQTGEIFGAAALFDRRETYESTITAKEPVTAAFFPEEMVLYLLGKYPSVAAAYVRYLNGRIHFLSQKVEALSAPGTGRKLACYLWQESKKSGTVTCSATELAKRLDMGRTSLYRAFEALEADNIIRRVGKTVEVLDREGLEMRMKG